MQRKISKENRPTLLFCSREYQAEKEANLSKFMLSLDESLINKMNSMKSEYNFDFQKEVPLIQTDQETSRKANYTWRQIQSPSTWVKCSTATVRSLEINLEEIEETNQVGQNNNFGARSPQNMQSYHSATLAREYNQNNLQRQIRFRKVSDSSINKPDRSNDRINEEELQMTRTNSIKSQMTQESGCQEYEISDRDSGNDNIENETNLNFMNKNEGQMEF